MANLKSTKDKQRSTKHTHKTKDRVTHRVKSCASRRVSSNKYYINNNLQFSSWLILEINKDSLYNSMSYIGLVID
jgi:hypothetical protein